MVAANLATNPARTQGGPLGSTCCGCKHAGGASSAPRRPRAAWGQARTRQPPRASGCAPLRARRRFTLQQDADGLPRGFSSDTPPPGGRPEAGAAGAGLFASVEAVRGAAPDAWRAALQGAPVRVERGRGYTLEFAGRSRGPNATATALFQSAATRKPLPGSQLLVALGTEWRRFALRLVSPQAGGDVSPQIQCGAKAGW